MSGTVYRMFDSADRLLYVGATTRLPKRIDEHSRDKAWWTEVTTISVEHFASRDDAFAAEAAAIPAESPVHNIVRVPTAKTYDMKERRRENREAREQERAERLADLASRGVYEFRLRCPNCGFHDLVELARGKWKHDAVCPDCGVTPSSQERAA